MVFEVLSGVSPLSAYGLGYIVEPAVIPPLESRHTRIVAALVVRVDQEPKRCCAALHLDATGLDKSTLLRPSRGCQPQKIV